MITKTNLKETLAAMGFSSDGKIYCRKFADGAKILVDFAAEKIIYPKGTVINRETTTNFSAPENFVVLECVTRLLGKGYRPEHIELEKGWQLGHDYKGGYADICVTDETGKMLFIVECKQFGNEYKKALAKTKSDGGQLFSYWQQERGCEWLALYAADYDEQKNRVVYETESIDCHDDKNILNLAKKDKNIKLYQNADTVKDLFAVWDETYGKRFCGDVIFRADTVAYEIGVKPLVKGDLKDFSENDKIINAYEEILRHNNVSDKENAFNRLTALFIAKLADELNKNDGDPVDFQYKIGTDTYETMQDRLQRLHRDGMRDFMREEIFYVEDDYIERTVKSYKGKDRKNLIGELNGTLQKLKFYTNNEFAFKDIHNEELFYQNGKILVEVVQLFQNYRLINSDNLQILGDLFEQLVNKGFKQNEGQFFTPVPVCRFVWDSLPLEKFVGGGKGDYPKILDYACGAGHFLTQGFEAINDCLARQGKTPRKDWARDGILGVEKDYRLARVSRIALFMHGAGDGKVFFGDGLDNYDDRGITAENCDILTTNPPFSVDDFKLHLKLLNNRLDVLANVSATGNEIETAFVERAAQTVKSGGAAAIILPSSILNKQTPKSFVTAREKILTNFKIRAIAQFSSKLFGATGTNVVILFLEKFTRPPEAVKLAQDTADIIIDGKDTDNDWEDGEIFAAYLKRIDVEENIYRQFVSRERDYQFWKDIPHFAPYAAAFENSAEYKSKTSRESFRQKTAEEQQRWKNQRFYELTVEKEREKILYFTLAYGQNVLIITSPDDTKGQKEFLGYDWSSRRGSEGIKPQNAGGALYDPADRRAENKLAALVRKSYGEKTGAVAELTEFYHYMPLTEMLDFSTAKFDKVIKTVKTNFTPIVYTGNYKTVKLGNVVSYGNSRISFADIELRDYITTDNMLKDKQGVKDFVGKAQTDSVIEYKKGDILISNIRPYLKKIWLAEKNGGCSPDVLVLQNIDEKFLQNGYLYAVLKQDAFFDYMMSTAKGMKMPRGDKAKMLDFEFPLPPLDVQQKIVDAFAAVDEKIAAQDALAAKCDEETKAKFAEMFGDEKFPVEKLGNICTVARGGSPRPIEQYLTTDSDGINWIKIGDADDSMYITKTSEKIRKEGIAKSRFVHVGDFLLSNSMSFGRPYILKIDGCIHDGWLVLQYDKTKLDEIYFYSYMTLPKTYEIMKNMTSGSVVSNLNSNIIKELPILLPPLPLQQEFAAYAREREEEKSAAREQKNALEKEREELVAKYFR